MNLLAALFTTTLYYYSEVPTNLRLVMREVARQIEHTLYERFYCRVTPARYERVERAMLRVCAAYSCVLCV